jgi:uncharacterized protein with beta-barrel porin domain
MKKILATTLALVMIVTMLAACEGGGSLSGTYKDPTETTSYTFKDGKVTAKAAGMELLTNAEFEVKDGKLYINGAEMGTVDGSTVTISGIKYKK